MRKILLTTKGTPYSDFSKPREAKNTLSLALNVDGFYTDLRVRWFRRGYRSFYRGDDQGNTTVDKASWVARWNVKTSIVFSYFIDLIV